MALEEFSTLASIQARANSKRVLGWTDKNADTIPDPETLAQGYQFASSFIFQYICQRYGETQIAAWTISTAPARVLSLSDDLCIWYFSSSNNAQNPLIAQIYEEAIKTLEGIRDGTLSLYGATEDMTDESYKFGIDDITSGYEDQQNWNCENGYSAISTCCNRCST